MPHSTVVVGIVLTLLALGVIGYRVYAIGYDNGRTKAREGAKATLQMQQLSAQRNTERWKNEKYELQVALAPVGKRVLQMESMRQPEGPITLNRLQYVAAVALLESSYPVFIGPNAGFDGSGYTYYAWRERPIVERS
jgi:hypothetical protein